MGEIGIRALRQNASGVVRAVLAGEQVTITDRGRAVARMSPIAASRLEQLLEGGTAVPARHSITDLKVPTHGVQLSDVLEEMREERF